MTIAKDVMGGGFSAGQAQALGGTVAMTVSAAGSTISDATALTASNNYVTTVASGAGVILPNGVIGDAVQIYNAGANPLKVYPPNSGSQKIAPLAAAAAVLCPTNTMMGFYKWSSTQWVAELSA